MSLPPELNEPRKKIEQCAKNFGLDFFQVVFEVLNWNEINVVASYGGFPSRYPHWRFGMEFERMSKSYQYGLSRIYEMVINNDPCYAYLLSSNGLVDQKMVMAHVFGHADFFKNNVYFAHTHRKMMDEMGNHRSRIQRYINSYGLEEVEGLIDKALSIENLIDIHKPLHPAKERDIYLFLTEHSPLEEWQKEILAILREEAYYFTPQAQTKILNEGWAAYWHSKIMTEKILDDSEVIDYASHHSATVSPHPGRLNPYKLGMELLRDIEKRFGHKKIFEVRKLHCDLTFLDEFLTEDFCREQKFFVYGYNQTNGTYEIIDRDFKKVKMKLLMSLTNLGSPIVQIIDGNYGGRGELCLKHLHEGIDLRSDWSQEVLKNLFYLWKKPVHVETLIEGIPKLLTFDGEESKEQRLN